VRPLAELKRFIERVEALEFSPFLWALVFFAIVLARNFLEQFGPERIVFDFPSFFLHFPFAYVAPVLGLSILLALLAREKVENVTRVMLFAWFLTLLPPLLDLATGRGTESRIAYLYVDRATILPMFVNFFNPAVHLEGTTPGIRVEAFLGCILASAYVFLKTRHAVRSLSTFFAVYFSFLFFFTLPYGLMAAVSAIWPRFGSVGTLYFEAGLFLKSHVNRVAYSIALFDLLLIVLLLVGWMRLYSRAFLAWVFRRLAGFTTVHYPLAVLFGIFLALKISGGAGRMGTPHVYDILAGLSLIISAMCGLWVARSTAEWSGWGARERFTGFVVVCLSLLFSGLVSYPALVFSLTFMAFLVLYYVQPLRLSRYFPLSTVLIGLATLSCAFMGFSTVADVLAPRAFPRELVLAIIASCAISLSAKDYVSGTRRGRAPAMLLLIFGFASVGLILRSQFLFWAGLILGGTGVVFLLLRLWPRVVLSATYAIFAVLIGLAIKDGQLSFMKSARLDGEEVLHLRRGKEFEIGRMYEEAAIEFEKAVSAGSDDPEVFFALGFAYQQAGDLGQSAYWYSRAVRKDEGYVEAYNNLGSVLTSLGQPDSAVAVLMRGLEKDPQSGRLLRNLFLALFDSQRYGELSPMLVHYLEANPEDYRTRELLADTYMQTGLSAAAETEFRKVLGSRKGYVPAIVGLGYIAANRGETEEAEKLFLVALDLDSTNVDAMHRLGYIYLERNDITRAISLFREVIKHEPLVANHYDSLGDAYMKAELYEKAEEAYQMAVGLDSKAGHAKEMLKKLEKMR
jgi:Tfp pilus assembly protein PilF